MNEIDIRQLTASDWSEWKELRIHGAKNHPNSFDFTLEELTRKSDDWYREQITLNTVFAAFLRSSNQMIGCICYFPSQIFKQRHRGEIGSVYLRPESRGLGIGKALFERVIQFVKENKPEVIQLHLSVGALNMPAVKLYQSIGFEIYGTEPRRLLGMNSEVDGLEYIDEHLMWLKLK